MIGPTPTGNVPLLKDNHNVLRDYIPFLNTRTLSNVEMYGE